MPVIVGPSSNLGKAQLFIELDCRIVGSTDFQGQAVTFDCLQLINQGIHKLLSNAITPEIRMNGNIHHVRLPYHCLGSHIACHTIFFHRYQPQG